jgi:membrane protease YdiL (CAAX protease family)
MKNATKASLRRQNPGIAASRATWLEIGAILLLVLAPSLSSLTCSLLWGSEYQKLEQDRRDAEYKTTTAFETAKFWSMVNVPVVLFVMWRSGKGWACFGLGKPRIGKDILIGLFLWLIAAIFSSFVDVAFERRPHPSFLFYPSLIPWHRGILLLADCCAIGFSEELVFRAYLIPRLEAVTGATWKSVVLSVVLFGFGHLSKGYVGVIHSVVAATILSIGFCLTRRLLPVAISHAISDFITGTRLSSFVGS